MNKFKNFIQRSVGWLELNGAFHGKGVNINLVCICTDYSDMLSQKNKKICSPLTKFSQCTWNMHGIDSTGDWRHVFDGSKIQGVMSKQRYISVTVQSWIEVEKWSLSCKTMLSTGMLQHLATAVRLLAENTV